MSDQAAHRLIWGIVEQACRDYMYFKRRQSVYRPYTNYAREYESVVRFFRSKWWDCLMPNVDGNSVMKKLDEIMSKGEQINVCEQ